MSDELLCTEAGVPLSAKMIRDRFKDARTSAATKVEESHQRDLTKRIRSFQFRDIRPKAASEIESLEEASALLDHTSQQITKQAIAAPAKLSTNQVNRQACGTPFRN